MVILTCPSMPLSTESVLRGQCAEYSVICQSDKVGTHGLIRSGYILFGFIGCEWLSLANAGFYWNIYIPVKSQN